MSARPGRTEPVNRHADQRAYAALEQLLNRMSLQKASGSGYIRLEFHQGGITNVRVATDEVFKPTT